jgi:uncharacterized protein (TIGR03083 family)
MTSTLLSVDEIGTIGHRDAMLIAQVEGARLLDVVDQLDDPDWSRPTDCEGWDVKALLSHALGAMEANTRLREFVHQFRVAAKASKRSGRPMIDEMTADQVRSHTSLSPAEMRRRMHALAASAVRGRRRIPAPMRMIPFTPGPPIEGKWTMGFLVDTIMNRDSWMHRVDLTRATGKELVLSSDHDGRIVADVVAEWARGHAKPFRLVLDGPAGGTFVHGEHGEELHLDAVEFCRTLSGRAPRSGLLEQEVPF